MDSSEITADWVRQKVQEQEEFEKGLKGRMWANPLEYSLSVIEKAVRDGTITQGVRMRTGYPGPGKIKIRERDIRRGVQAAQKFWEEAAKELEMRGFQAVFGETTIAHTSQEYRFHTTLTVSW